MSVMVARLPMRLPQTRVCFIMRAPAEMSSLLTGMPTTHSVPLVRSRLTYESQGRSADTVLKTADTTIHTDRQTRPHHVGELTVNSVYVWGRWRWRGTH